MEVRFRGEDEFFPLRLNELYPDAQAALLGENLVRLSDIAAVRVFNPRRGIKTYCLVQGVVNLVTIGLAVLLDRTVREEQAQFAGAAAAVSGAMVLFGSVDRVKTRDVSADGRYLLAIGGGVRAMEEAPERPRRY